MIANLKTAILARLKTLFSWENWHYWAVALIAVLIIALIVYVIRHRRNKKIADADQKKDSEISLFKPNTLAKKWKTFLKGIPTEFRRSLVLYQPFVVLGESGSGKTLMIDNYTDWKGQSRQFYPSYTSDPVIQFYLGSKILVQEIPGTLLDDTSEQARIALLKLWKPFFQGRSPKVIVAVNSMKLLTESPESLKKQAQTVRGKINLLSSKRSRPAQIGIALTFMNHVEGCSEFFDFLMQHQIPLRIEFESEKSSKEFADYLERYEDFLKNALMALPADNYLKIISFMRRMPEIFAVLSEFMQVLRNPDPLSVQPRIAYLCMVSDREKDSDLSNPFRLPLFLQSRRRYYPQLKHQIAAAAMMIAGIAYFAGSYIYERNLLTEAERKLSAVEKSPPAQYDDEMHRLFSDFSGQIEKKLRRSYLPEFFPNYINIIQRRLLDDMRKFYLLPRFEQTRSFPDEEIYEKKLYILSVIYGSMSNQLGDMVLKNIDKWASQSDLPKPLIEDYIRKSKVSWGTAIQNVGNLAYQKAIIISTDPQPWLIFFNEISKSLEKPFISKEYLDSLQKKAEKFLDILDEYEHRDFTLKIVNLLKSETPLDIRKSWFGEIRESQLKQDAIRKLLIFIRQQTISYSPPQSVNFAQLLQNVEIMMTGKAQGQSESFNFYLAGKDFSFNSRQIGDLMARSSITLLLREFIARRDQSDGMFFFRADEEFPAISLNPESGGMLYFTGNATINGKFTKKAFEEVVKPSLAQLPKLLKILPIAEDEKVQFSNFVIRGVKAYSARYALGFRSYYDAFAIEADTVGALRYVLNQIQLPSSQFQNLLFTIRENTIFEIETNPFTEPFAVRLREFDSFKRIFREDKGIYPEMEKYKAILGQMQQDLENSKPFVPKNAADDAKELKSRLSPAGRIAFSIFRSEEDSYLNMVKMWISSAGISPQWDRLFTEPVLQAYEIGMADAESLVDKTWKALLRSDIRPIVKQFPFDKRSDSITDPAELESVIHPQGRFWKTATALFAPVCIRNNTEWQERKGFRLPDDMIKTLNDAEKLSALLWDDKGKPKALSFSIKPDILPISEYHNGAVAVMAYLRAGQSAAYAFNQQPSWGKFELEWWKKQPASVGAEFVKPGEKTKSYQTLALSESEWSFHKLLMKAKSVDKDSVAWEIPSGDENEKPLSIRFIIKPDPWKLTELLKKDRE